MPSELTPRNTPRTRRARGSLSAEEILDAAAKIVEEEGLDQLSMPRLARTLGCGVTSLYWYFRSKDELVEALVDRVSRDAFTRLPPIGNGTWDEELVAYYVAFRSLMHRSALYREVLAHTRVTFAASRLGRQVLRRTDAGLALITQLGFDATQAAIIYSAFSNYTMGFIMREYAAGADDDDDAVTINEQIARLGPTELPVLAEVDDFGTIRSYGDEQFVAGLRLLLQGVRRELEAPSLAARADRDPRSEVGSTARP